MWTRIDSTEFYISYSPSRPYDISITNFVTLWTTKFTKGRLIQCLQESNDGLEIKDEQLILNGIKLLSNPNNLKRFVPTKKDDEKVLHVAMTVLFGYPFNLKFDLVRGTRECFFLKVTQPLLRTVQDLHSSQSKLIKLLNKKDSEIEEYKCEGGEIALRHLRTVVFNEKEHLNNHMQFQDTFGAAGVSTSLLQKEVSVSDKNTKIKKESADCNNTKRQPDINVVSEIKVKAEPESQNSQSLTAAQATDIADIKQEIKTEISGLTPRKKKKKLNY